VRIVGLQLGLDPGLDFDERVAAGFDLARTHRDADLIVLPELWPNGGFTYDRWAPTAQPVDGPFVAGAAGLARELGCHLHAGSFIEALPDGGLANTAVLFAPDGSLLASYRKIHLFGFADGEPKYLTAGSDLVVVDTAIGRVGLATCYDLRFAEQFRRLGDDGAQLVVVPAAWPAARVGHWTVLAQARAIENQYVVVAVNAAGADGRLTMGGRSLVVDARGQVLAEAGDAPTTIAAAVDLVDVSVWREQFPMLGDRRLPSA
jgi:predicted amidohydrolase